MPIFGTTAHRENRAETTSTILLSVLLTLFPDSSTIVKLKLICVAIYEVKSGFAGSILAALGFVGDGFSGDRSWQDVFRASEIAVPIAGKTRHQGRAAVLQVVV